ncbi:MAG: LD-carboxypeptidase [Ignavibacteriaceae bacterium]|nr:LD-carboxypeptidase [Ignavibacteriaceae bacterium]
MDIIKAKKLNRGDVIGIISPSSPVSDRERLDGSVSYFESMGYRVRVGKNVLKERGYLAGTDEERVEDIHSMFLDDEVKLIICLRGGYGAARLLDKIDYNIIKKHPKIFCGYSDITVLQNAIFKKTGLVTLAGPMAGVDFYKDINEWTAENFWKTVTSGDPVKISNVDGAGLKSLIVGKAEGRLIGGNLSLFSSLSGTEYLPEPKGTILMLEDVGEVPYKIDRMLNQLRLSGYVERIAGVLLASFTDCIETDPLRKSLTLEEVMSDYFNNNLHVPVVYNLNHGHVTNNLTIPIGVKVRLDGDNCRLEFLESHLV